MTQQHPSSGAAPKVSGPAPIAAEPDSRLAHFPEGLELVPPDEASILACRGPQSVPDLPDLRESLLRASRGDPTSLFARQSMCGASHMPIGPLLIAFEHLERTGSPYALLRHPPAVTTKARTSAIEEHHGLLEESFQDRHPIPVKTLTLGIKSSESGLLTVGVTFTDDELTKEMRGKIAQCLGVSNGALKSAVINPSPLQHAPGLAHGLTPGLISPFAPAFAAESLNRWFYFPRASGQDKPVHIPVTFEESLVVRLATFEMLLALHERAMGGEFLTRIN